MSRKNACQIRLPPALCYKAEFRMSGLSPTVWVPGRRSRVAARDRLGVPGRRGRHQPGRLGRLASFRSNACVGSAPPLSWTCCGRGAVAA